MCVTNIVKRHPRPVASNVNSSMVSKTPSLISQRLMSNFMPLMNKTSEAEPLISVPAMNVVPPQPQHNTFSQPSFNFFAEPTQHNTKYDSSEDKSRPKRRRKPQKPGKTAKMNDRHFVVHNYHDHALDPDEHDEEVQEDVNRRGGVSISFPMKLHTILDQVEAHGLGHIVSWQKHGRCFVIHKTKEFTDHVMPHYFRQTKLTSFQRQLNLYGFCRLTRGPDAGGYYHELFLRGKVFLAKRMQRTKIKGTKFKAASSPEQEPDFYTMPPVVVTPSNSSDDSSHDGQIEQVIARKKAPPQITPSLLQNALNMNMDPFALQAPRNDTVPSVEPNQLFPVSQAPVTQYTGFSSFFSSERGADQTLDDAVDELFNSAPEMSDLQQLDEMWDNTEFGEEKIQDDLQLGYMLESLLE